MAPLREVARPGSLDLKRSCPACGSYRNAKSEIETLRCLSCGTSYVIFPLPCEVEFEATKVDLSSPRARGFGVLMHRKPGHARRRTQPFYRLLPERSCHVLAVVPSALESRVCSIANVQVSMNAYRVVTASEPGGSVSRFQTVVSSAQPESYDAVLMEGALQVNQSPVALMSHVHSALVVGGYVAVCVPKRMSFQKRPRLTGRAPFAAQARAERQPQDSQIGWIAFSEQGLQSLAKVAGFAQVQVLVISARTAQTLLLASPKLHPVLDLWTDALLGKRDERTGLRHNPFGAWLLLIARK